MQEHQVIWKAINTQNFTVVGKGVSILNSAVLRNILKSYLTPSNNSIILEIYDMDCKDILLTLKP